MSSSSSNNNRRFAPFFVSIVFSIVAILFSVVYVYSRSYSSIQTDKEQVLGITITFTTLVFGLLLGFTVSNFWQKFIELNETVVDEVQSLLRMIRIAKDYPGTENLIAAIRTYASDTLYNEWPLLKGGASSLSSENEEFFRKIVVEMNTYSKANPLNAEVGILYSLIPPRQKLNSFVNRGSNEALIYFNISCAVITVISFWFLRIGNNFVQIVVDAAMISTIAISIFILYEFYKPFNGVFKVDLGLFKILLEEPI